MANSRLDRAKSWREREEREIKNKKMTKVISLFSFFFVVVILLLMFVDWAAVYNTDIAKNEVEISGFNCVSSGLSGNYASPNKGRFGDMAVPFNYYASSYVRPLAKLSAAVMFVVVVHILVALFSVIAKKKKPFFCLCVLLAVTEAVLFILCYAKGLSMKNSMILHSYCKDNPACSIHSQAIIPAIFSILYLALPIYALALGRNRKEAALLTTKGEKGKGKQTEGPEAKVAPATGQTKRANPRATAFKGNKYTKH